MIRFGSPPTAGSTFLQHCKERIDLLEFESLRKEPGFSAPNTFSVEQVVQPLLRERFPVDNHYEYLWALYECGLDALRPYSAWMRVYLSSLYVYCNKVRIWGMTVECDYYEVLIETARESGTNSLPAQALLFVEWLDDHVEADQGYDDYFCLLCWAFLRRIVNKTGDEQFQAVMAELVSKRYSKERLGELTVSDRWPASWLELNRRVPATGEAMHREFEKVICGA